MAKLQSIDAFTELQKRLMAGRNPDLPTIVLSAGTCGQASGANDLIRITKRELLERALTKRVRLRITGCHGFCQMEPSVLVEPRGTFYPRIGIVDMSRIVEAVARGDTMPELFWEDPKNHQRIEKQADIPFFKKQQRTILSRNEKVDPIRIMTYLENGGYAALASLLRKPDPEWMISEVKTSGLRGRGGAGFPTGLKWEMLAKARSRNGKYLVCNADEGDPGAYMDRSVLEGNPHSVLEGILVGALATGAKRGVIYVRSEYPLAIKHLVIALRQAREMGLLGERILGTDFSFDIQMVKGAGAFVCGEETALIHSIEGKMGEPRQRPPYPVEKGINGQPTAINNVETWANIPVIFEHGAVDYAEVGTEGNRGTKIFSLVGKITNTGLVEVPMGMTIGEIVHDIGGGPSTKAAIKAVQTGGPSGGCIPVSKFDLAIDYDSLAAAGSIMGSGGMIVMDENTCMVDIAKYFMKFLKDESCGKCFTCRKGTQRMYEILDDICTGKADLSHIDLLAELAEVVKDTTMCGLGQTASNPVLSTLRHFRREYERHILQKRCDAFVCTELVGAPCQAACPLGTEAWRYIAHLAKGEYEQAYFAIREHNPFPSVCGRVCNHPCESRCRSGTAGTQAISIRTLKRFVTDRISPLSYRATRTVAIGPRSPKVAIVGSGPAGLTAAHYLSLSGHRVTVFESADLPGGMLTSCIPAYRLPRQLVEQEIESVLDETIELRCNQRLGRDFTLDDLLAQGFGAVFLAMGAHKSRRLNVEGEDLEGVYPAIEFLKAYNLHGRVLARGHVGVIGGGDSAVDAARVALRQPGVSEVTIFYRRTREEMPALSEEVDAAVYEGVRLLPMTSPVQILSKQGRLTGVRCIRNEPGKADARGRRQPIPVPGTEFDTALDSLIVTIGDVPDVDYLASMGIATTEAGTVQADAETLLTNRDCVFAGGDVITGPNTVVEAIAAGKKAAVMIGRCLAGEPLRQPAERRLPSVYVEPAILAGDELSAARRVAPPSLDKSRRRAGFEEVELTLAEDEACLEARRCLRCDLEFTQRKESPHEAVAGKELVQ